jgi:UDP-glucuronate decarboxylase
MHPSDGRVVSNFIIQALNGDAITLYGDGQQTRSFCYVDDLVGGLIKLMESDTSVTGPINIGNPVEFTMRGLADLVLAETGSSSPITTNPLPQDDPKQRRPDITRAKEQLRWSPSISLAEGLKPTVAYFRSLRSSLGESCTCL